MKLDESLKKNYKIKNNQIDSVNGKGLKYNQKNILRNSH